MKVKKKALDALFATTISGPLSKRPVTSVTVKLGVGVGNVPFPKVSLGPTKRHVYVTFALFQAICIVDGPSFSSGMVVSIPASSNVSVEQVYAIVGFAQAKGPPRNEVSEEATFIRNVIQGFYVILAKVRISHPRRAVHFALFSVLHTNTHTHTPRFPALKVSGRATAKLSKAARRPA